MTSKQQFCDCGTGDKSSVHAMNCRIELVADQVGDFLYDHCGWRPTGDAQWQKLKNGIPGLARLLQLPVETSAPRYLRPSMGTALMFSRMYKMAVTDEWCRGWNALLSALEAAGCEADSNSPWPPLVPCPDCKGAGEVCVGNSGRDDDGNAPILEPCDTCDRYGRIAPNRPELKTEREETASPLTSQCPTCKTELAFVGDVCGLCNPETRP